MAPKVVRSGDDIFERRRKNSPEAKAAEHRVDVAGMSKWEIERDLIRPGNENDPILKAEYRNRLESEKVGKKLAGKAEGLREGPRTSIFSRPDAVKNGRDPYVLYFGDPRVQGQYKDIIVQRPGETAAQKKARLDRQRQQETQNRSDMVKWLGLGEDATAKQIYEATVKRREEAEALTGGRAAGWRATADRMWAEHKAGLDKAEAGRRHGVLQAAGATGDAAVANVSDLVGGGFGGVKFTGAGGLPYALNKGARPSGISNYQWGQMAARAAHEGAAYKAMQEQQRQNEAKQAREKSFYINDNYNLIRAQQERDRAAARVAEQATKRETYALNLLEQENRMENVRDQQPAPAQQPQQPPASDEDEEKNKPAGI